MSTSTEQWGNIELPGLSDEKLFATNWHHVAVNKQIGATEKHRNTSSKNNKITWSNPAIRQKRLEGLRSANQRQEVIEKKTHANQKKSLDPLWREKNLKNIMSRARPIIDDSNVVYESMADCARKLAVSIGTIQYYLKKGKFKYQ